MRPFEEAIGRVEIGRVPCEARQRRPGAPAPLACVGRGGARGGLPRLVDVAAAARDLGAHRVDLGTLDAHEGDPGAARLSGAGERGGELHRERRRGEPSRHLVLGERECLGVRDRAGELADEARRALGPLRGPPRDRPRLALAEHVLERPRRGLPHARQLDDARHERALAAVLDAERPRRRARPYERHQPPRAPHGAERFDDVRALDLGARERLRRGGRGLDPRAGSLADRGRDDGAAEVEHVGALREVRPAHPVDARLRRLALVCAQREATRGPSREPRRARPAPRRGGEERQDPARRLAGRDEIRLAGGARLAGRSRRAGCGARRVGPALDRRARVGGAFDGRVEDLGEEHAEGPEVRRRPRLGALAKLGRCVPRRPAERLGAGLRGQAQVDERRAPIVGGVARRGGRGAEDVRGLHVAVMEPRLVKLLERPRHAMGDDGGEMLAVRARRPGEARCDGDALDPLRDEEVRPRVEERRTPAPSHAGEELGLTSQRRGGARGVWFRLFEGTPPSRLRVIHAPDQGGGAFPASLDEQPRAQAWRQLVCHPRQRAHFL